MRWSCAAALLFLMTSVAGAGEVRDGVLLVDGKPFYPLGSWNFATTTPEDIARLGMNTSFQGGPGTEAAVEQFRGFMRRANGLGIQVVPYLSFGGAGVTPWASDAVRAIAKLSTEPNLLAWYVGDDITMKHLDGIRQTVSILRAETPGVPTAADYIARETPEARTVFTQFVDIRCQYDYPVPDKTYAEYLAFFDQQRAFVGDPLWTWVQSFMWGRTGQFLEVGAEGPGPVPDPEQVRLLSFAAINRAVRGLLFFAHHELHRLPELAAEVAFTCHEVRLLSNHLAAGAPTFNLPSSNPDLNVTALHYGGSTVLSAALFKPFYHRYVDEGVIHDVSITCPWSSSALPKALLVATPDVVECTVAAGAKTGTVAVTIPRLELAGFVLLTQDASEQQRLRQGVAAVPDQLRSLMIAGAAAQTRKVCSVVWQLGMDHLYQSESAVMDTVRAQERCADATAAGASGEAFRAWRDTLRNCRGLLSSAMRFADDRRDAVPAKFRNYLASPYGLHNIPGLGDAPDKNDPWRFCQEWLVAGPFQLEADLTNEEAVPPGFERPYPPESEPAPGAVFDTLDGRSTWRQADGDISGLLNLRGLFAHTDNVVAYARGVLEAPRAGNVRLGIGSNDGARLWINGQLVYSQHVSRAGSKRDDEVTVPVHKGANTILAKVENLGLGWKLYLSIYDPDRIYSFVSGTDGSP